MTGHTCSSVTPSRSRLVARIRARPGAPVTVSTTEATASTRCSQLSSTTTASSSPKVRRAAVGPPASARIPTQWSNAGTIASGSTMAARSTNAEPPLTRHVKLGRHLNGEPRLADAARPDQRHQPRRAEQLHHGGHVGRASDDRRSPPPLVGNELADEPVAVPTYVADEPLLRTVVADGPPDLLDPGGQRGLRDEPIAPHLVEQLLLGHDPLAVRQQVGEHVERSGLEVLDSPVEADLAGSDVDGAIVEADHSTESRVAEPSQASLSESSDSRQANEHC